MANPHAPVPPDHLCARIRRHPGRDRGHGRRPLHGLQHRQHQVAPGVGRQDAALLLRVAAGAAEGRADLAATSARAPTARDDRYDDVYVNGEDLTAPHPSDPTRPLRSDITLPYQSIAILRYYDDASADFGDGESHPIEEFARGLSDLILRLRTLVCRKGGKHPIRATSISTTASTRPTSRSIWWRIRWAAWSAARSCRTAQLGGAQARAAVDKLFTYATPHNGIDLRIVRNVPGWSAFGEATNFNRERMVSYSACRRRRSRFLALVGFPPERVFNLVGTNPADYLVAKGLSSWAVGDSSDGLVRMDNATTFGRVGETAGRVAARLHISQPLGPVRHRQFGRGLPEPHPVPVRLGPRRRLARRLRRKLPTRSRRPTSGPRFRARVIPLRRSSPRCARANGSCTAASCGRTRRSNAPTTSCFRKAPTASAPRAQPTARTCSRCSSTRKEPEAARHERRVRLRRGDPRARLPDRRRALAQEALRRRLPGAKADHRRGDPRRGDAVRLADRIRYAERDPERRPEAGLRPPRGGALKFEIQVGSPAGARPGVTGQLRIEIRNWH